MNIHVSQIELVGAILESLDKLGVKSLLERELNTVIRCATEIVNELAKLERKVTPGMGLDAWLVSDHVGSSSAFMASVLTGKLSRDLAYPHDPDDFGRCIGLLDACPELREHLPRLLGCGPQWAALVSVWDELEAMYRDEVRTGSAPRLMARMRDLLKE
jgi:hypothetical protein